MSPSEWPRSEYDPSALSDANTQHMMTMLEGYRARVLCLRLVAACTECAGTGRLPGANPIGCGACGSGVESPYHPGGARDFSWRAGYAQAEKDIR
jgi:hypothetical protein